MPHADRQASTAAQCCDKVYFCPTSGETECPVHGGFDVCCDRPNLHRPVASAACAHGKHPWVTIGRWLVRCDNCGLSGRLMWDGRVKAGERVYAGR